VRYRFWGGPGYPEGKKVVTFKEGKRNKREWVPVTTSKVKKGTKPFIRGGVCFLEKWARLTSFADPSAENLMANSYLVPGDEGEGEAALSIEGSSWRDEQRGFVRTR